MVRPGVGKTAAARVVLEDAKRSSGSPFGKDAKFIELDATTARFDERGIADPLIGSVHDPIYQGAGSMGVAGIPQPKAGAVTKAHGGMLFIDEIGELHPVQMNKLLKVLEDRKVFLESAYYSSEDNSIPVHIHDIFQNGLPADFRLVGATTRSPEEIPPAIRSRCMEIFFRPLRRPDIEQIVRNATVKIGMPIAKAAVHTISDYATNGREAVNIVQIAGGLALTEQRNEITEADILWVIEWSQLSPRPANKLPDEPAGRRRQRSGCQRCSSGILLELEVTAMPAKRRRGTITVGGLVEEETVRGRDRSMRRKSMAKSSLDNVVTVLQKVAGLDLSRYDLHVNFPGGAPVDGPSAGIAMATAIYSAVRGIPVRHDVAMTGEVSLRGLVKPVGGVPAKIDAALEAGAKTVLIPRDNWQTHFADTKDAKVVPVERLEDVLKLALVGGMEASFEPFSVSVPIDNTLNSAMTGIPQG